MSKTSRVIQQKSQPPPAAENNAGSWGKSFRPSGVRVFASESEGALSVWRCRFDGEECLIDMDVFARAGKLWSRSKEEHVEFFHSPERLSGALREAGFSVKKTLDGYPGALADGEGTRLVFVCKRA